MKKKTSVHCLSVLENYKVKLRRETFEGRPHLIAPAVILLEGVHVGTGGAIFYPADEIAHFCEAWNGVPLPIMHPTTAEGVGTIVNVPKTLENSSVGRFFNVEFDLDGAKLRGELWIDIQKAEAIAPNVLSTVENGLPLEVSSSMFGDEDNIPGVWKGEAYRTTLFNYRPDHVALLPGEQGACSLDDGCGVRSNKGSDFVVKNFSLNLPGLSRKIKSAVRDIMASIGFSNEQSHDDIREELRDKIREITPDGSGIWVREVYDDHVVYEMTEYDDGMPSGPEKLFDRSYTIDSEGGVVLGIPVTEVKEETKYVPVITPTGNADREDDSEEVTGMVKKEIVQALIACNCTRFVKDDEKWLMTLEESQLEKMGATEDVIKANSESTSDDSADSPTDSSDDTPPKSKEDEKEEEEEEEETKDPMDGDDPVTLEAFIGKAPPEIQSVLTRAVENERQAKKDMVDTIMSNERNSFKRDRLEAMDIADLSQMVQFMGGEEPNFSVRPGGPVDNVDDDAVPDMPKVFETK